MRHTVITRAAVLAWCSALSLAICSHATAQAPNPLSGEWTIVAEGCDESGSFYAVAASDESTVVRIAQEGAALSIEVQGRIESGEPYSFPAPGFVNADRVVLYDPLNSSYMLVGEFANDTISLRPDTRRILAAWPGWANPPRKEDLDRCRIVLQRRAGAASAPVVMQPHVNPYEGIPPGVSAFLDRDSLLTKTEARRIEDRLKDFRKKRSPFFMSVLMVSSTKPESLESYANRAASAYGTGGAAGGALLVLASSDRSVCLMVGEQDAARIPPELADKVAAEVIEPLLSQGKPYEAIVAGIDAIDGALEPGSGQRP